MPKENKKSNLARYAQLSGIAFQMMAIMFVFIWLGKKGDERWGGEDAKLFTLLGTLLGMGASLYLVIKQLKNING